MILAENTGTIFSTSVGDPSIELNGNLGPFTLFNTPHPTIRAAGEFIKTIYTPSDTNWKNYDNAEFLEGGNRVLLSLNHITDEFGTPITNQKAFTCS